MADPLVPLSPDWWLARLYKQLAARSADIALMTSYYEGDHPLPWLAPQARAEFRRILRMTRSNYMGLVVDAMVERAKVEGFRMAQTQDRSDNGGDQDIADLDADIWRIWQANNMDAGSNAVMLESAICRTAYIQLAVNPKDPTTPFMWPEHPLQAIVDYEPGTGRSNPVAALKVYLDDWTGTMCAVLQLPGNVFKYGSEVNSSGIPIWTRRDIPGEEWGGPNEAGEVTLVEVPNNPRMLTGGVSEIKDVTDIQDRINKTIADRLITQDYGAFPQKWMTGWPVEDEQGNPTPAIDIGRSRVVSTDVDNAKFGQWDAAPLDPYSAAKREDVKDIASRTRTPAQYLLGEMSNVSGDAVALDTLVPTPTGLVAMGDIRTGDLVFDEDGQVQTVEQAHTVLLDRECYRIEFDDHSTVIADGGHRWPVISIPERQRQGKGRATRSDESVVSTAGIARTQRCANGQATHAVKMAQAPDLPDADLPVDPWVMGVYLGNGSRHHGSITEGVQDLAAISDLLTQAGENPVARETAPGVHQITCKKSETVTPLKSRLIEAGVLMDKHIPEAYFAASFKQRLALLRGLMDTDGTASKTSLGMVSIALHNERLSRDVYRLICSLGHKVCLRERHAPYSGGIVGQPVQPTRIITFWSMQWTAPDVVFLLPRKAAIQAIRPQIRPKRVMRAIISVLPVESVPVRCLTVSGPSHLYLLGVEHIPTHNTLQASQAGLIAKVGSRCVPWGEGFEAAARIARKLAGLPVLGGPGLETIWHNPEFRTLGELTDAVVKKLQVGIVDLRQAREDCGYSSSQILRMESREALAAQAAVDLRNRSMLNAISDFNQPPLPIENPSRPTGSVR